MRCYKYHSLGHIASDCPNKRVIPWQNISYLGGRDEGGERDLGRRRGGCWTWWWRIVGDQESPQCSEKCQGWI